MQTRSIDLLKRALALKKAAAWARELNVTETAISLAKKRGRLSPTMAGYFAIRLGEDPIKWAGVAALEAEPDSPLLLEVKQTAQRVTDCILCLIDDRPRLTAKLSQLARMMRACSFWRP